MYRQCDIEPLRFLSLLLLFMCALAELLCREECGMAGAHYIFTELKVLFHLQSAAPQVVFMHVYTYLPSHHVSRCV